MKQKIKLFFKRKKQEEKIILPKWSVDLARRLDITDVQLADSISRRSIYAFLWKPYTRIFLLYCGIFALTLISYWILKGQDMTIPATRYVAVTSDLKPIAFKSLRSDIDQQKLKDFVKECLEGLYTLNSKSFVQTFVQNSNLCVRASSQSKLIEAFISSGLDELLIVEQSSRNKKVRSQLLSAEISSVEIKGARDTGSSFEYGVEALGVINRTDFTTGQTSFVTAKWQLVIGRVNEFVSESGFIITRHRLMWEYQ